MKTFNRRNHLGKQCDIIKQNRKYTSMTPQFYSWFYIPHNLLHTSQEARAGKRLAALPQMAKRRNNPSVHPQNE